MSYIKNASWSINTERWTEQIPANLWKVYGNSKKKNLSTSKSPEILSTASVFLKNEWKMPRFHSTASKSEWNSIKWIIRFSFKRDSVEFRWVWPFSMFMKSKLWLRCRKGVTSIEKNVLFVRKITFHWIISADTICIHYSSFALIFVMGRQML